MKKALLKGVQGTLCRQTSEGVRMYEYTHIPLGEEVTALAGSYWKTEEGWLLYNDKKVLYFLGSTSTICCCAGDCPGFEYIMVPGYIKAWQYRKNEEGLLVSAIEPIQRQEEKREIRKILQEKYRVSQVEFW